MPPVVPAHCAERRLRTRRTDGGLSVVGSALSPATPEPSVGGFPRG
jgi:hypothetical protein